MTHDQSIDVHKSETTKEKKKINENLIEINSKRPKTHRPISSNP